MLMSRRLNTCRRLVVGFLVAVLSVSGLAARTGAPGEISLTLMASTSSWADQEFVGHAFMCIGYHLNSGIQESCYGFYPRLAGPGAFVGGPGVSLSEFLRNPSRFSRVTVSVTRVISEAQRRAVLAEVNRWNQQDYRLVTSNCINFVDAVARAGGLTSPGTRPSEMPAAYLGRLKTANP
jgi:hypothetical protein